MMGRAALFGLIAMVPAALNAAPARMLAMPVCDGAGAVRIIAMPLDSPLRPGQDDTGCCAKGCHAPSSRKRGNSCHFDPSQ